MNLSAETAIGLLRNIDRYTAADYDALGINAQDFELVNDGMPWDFSNKHRVIATLNALIHGTVQILGLPKIVVPAEYIAALIVACVDPANRMLACTFIAGERQVGPGALEGSARASSTSQIDPTSADQLFALVCLLSANEHANSARRAMQLKLGLAVQKAAEDSATQ